MVVTPDIRPLDASTPISPLLAATRTPQSPATPALSTSAGHGGGGIARPLLRKGSTGSFSKLADFWLDGTPSVPGTPMETPTSVQGIPNVNLSIDAR